jgi:hypothetical protein
MEEFLHAAGTAVVSAAMAKRAPSTAGAAVKGEDKAVQAGVQGQQFYFYKVYDKKETWNGEYYRAVEPGW